MRLITKVASSPTTGGECLKTNQMDICSRLTRHENHAFFNCLKAVLWSKEDLEDEKNNRFDNE